MEPIKSTYLRTHGIAFGNRQGNDIEAWMIEAVEELFNPGLSIEEMNMLARRVAFHWNVHNGKMTRENYMRVVQQAFQSYFNTLETERITKDRVSRMLK